MKDGYVMEKSSHEPESGDLELINRQSRRKLAAEDVYTFKTVLCDNEIDRDGERFSVDALNTLAKLFVGKTGIFDHSLRSGDQCARIYDAQVECEPEKKTLAGESYHRLVAKAYMPVTSRNRDLITEIDAGIKKEVSVGCRVESVVCSVCGADRRRDPCGHLKGEEYDGKVCHDILDKPTDAYEWSFVAVPAQREAGVIKSFAKSVGERSMEDILKSLSDARNDVTLSKESARKLSEYITLLRGEAADGREYRRKLCDDMVRMSALVQPELDSAVLKDVAKRMTLSELKCFKNAFEKRLGSAEVQLGTPSETDFQDNNDYMI